jgi:hypothetical protein
MTSGHSWQRTSESSAILAAAGNCAPKEQRSLDMTNANFEQALYARLPATLHARVPDLAQLLADASRGGQAATAAPERLRNPAFAPLLRALAGQTLNVGGQAWTIGSTLIVGDVGTLQQVTISGGSAGDIIGSQIVIQLPPLAPALHQLRAPVADFVGREEQIERLVAALDKPALSGAATAISGIRGLGGIGKTELAYAVAQRLAPSYPDAQIVLGLHGASSGSLSPALALQQVIDAFAPEEKLPDDLARLQNLYRAKLAGKRALILADDAKDAAQVRLLLPPPGSLLLITSRNRFELPGMTTFDLEVLTEAASIKLLLRVCPRIGAHGAQLARLCGYLPLALRISAALLASDDARRIERYLKRLEAERLRYLNEPDAVDDPAASVEASLRLSYDALKVPAQQALAQLSIFRISFDRAAALAVVETDDDTEDLLADLRRRSLLEWDQATERFDLHDLVREFGAARLADADPIQLRFARHYGVVAQHAGDLYRRRRVPEARALFDQERTHIESGSVWVGRYAGKADMERLLGAYDIAARYYRNRSIWLLPSYAATLDAILNQNDALVHKSRITTRLVALHGMGGSGKTTLARGLLEDPLIQEAFPDGIFWATLGQKPDLFRHMRVWIEALGGYISEYAPSVNSLKYSLAQLLKDRACLLIVDDAWNREHVELFQVGGARCCLLVTTRDAAPMEVLGAIIYRIPLMTVDEAVTLLENWSYGQLAQVDRALKERIVERLGYLPLAIKLAGVQLQSEAPMEWLASFNVRALDALYREEAHDSVEGTFGISLDTLSADTRRLYVSLAIFREAEAIPEVAIARLWEGLGKLQRYATHHLLDDLAARALLDMRLEVMAEGPARHVVLHDLLRDLLYEELGEQRVTAHNAILEAYRATCKDNGWHTAPDDGYLYDHLAYHLDAVGAAGELKGLFADQHWLHARVPQRGYHYDGYLADLHMVWNHADAEARRQIYAGQESVAIADCVRYALLCTSVNSIAANYTPALVAQAVKKGVWSLERAISVAAKIPSAVRRFRMYQAILGIDGLSAEQRSKLFAAAVHAVSMHDDIEDRSYYMEELYNDTRQSPSASRRAGTQELDAALKKENPQAKAYTLLHLLPHLSDAQRETALPAAFEAAWKIDGAWARAELLTGLVPYLSESQRQEALAAAFKAACEISNNESRASRLIALLPYLLDERREEAVAAAFEAACAVRDKEWGYQKLTGLAPYLPPALLGPALEAAREIKDEKNRAGALVGLLPYLPDRQHEAVVAEAFETVRVIGDAKARATALTSLASYLPPAMLASALEIACAIEDAEVCAAALIGLGPHLPSALLGSALQAARAIKQLGYRTSALTALAPYLPPAMLADVLDEAHAIRDEAGRSRALTNLAWQLPGPQCEAALAAAFEAARKELFALLPHQTNTHGEEDLAVALQQASQIRSDERLLAKVLNDLAPHLPSALLPAAFEAACMIKNEQWRSKALTDLAPYLSEPQCAAALTTALKAARAIKNAEVRASSLTALAPLLPEAQRTSILANALTAAQAIGDEQPRSSALTALVPQLPGPQRASVLANALTAAQAIGDEQSRAEALVALAPYLPSTLLTAVLGATRSLVNADRRARALAGILPYIGHDTATVQLIRAALAEHVWAIKDQSRSEVLNFCADTTLFIEPILSAVTLGEIAAHIIEICQGWLWL